MVQCTRLGFNRDRGIYLEPSGSPAARLAWDRTRGGGGSARLRPAGVRLRLGERRGEVLRSAL